MADAEPLDLDEAAAVIAEEHWFTAYGHTHCVGCGWVPDRKGEDITQAMRRHIAAVALAEVRRLRAELADANSREQRVRALAAQIVEDGFDGMSITEELLPLLDGPVDAEGQP